VIVRHIQIPAKDAGLLNEATARLARGEPFEEVARALSQNPDSAGRGGEMDPFTFDDATIPPLLREAAFSLKPGEVSSPLRTDAMCHILKLERRIEPEGVRLEDVRDKVETQLRERELTESFQRLMQELYERANVQVLDRRLKDDFEKARRQQAAAQRNP
jgi:parvulin-like peptidyl-prolyl isomerase